MIKTLVTPEAAFLNLGFRPFFLGAAIFAVISMAFWMAIYSFQMPLPIAGVSLFQWHAHAMIYGFAMAVIAGFLLTAVRNWTGVQTSYGLQLLGLFILWALPRIIGLFGTNLIMVAAICDLLFMLGLIGAVVYPIAKARQWRQSGIVMVLVLLLLANGCFYLGARGVFDEGVRLGIYGGLFLIVGLILLIGRRVIPFFIEAGVGYPVKLVNFAWLDQLIIGLYLVFLIAEVGLQQRGLIALTALGLAIANSVRMVWWHTQGIWRKPLLWSLFVAFGFINLGFLLSAFSAIFNLPNMIAIHAFSIGGIGIVTLSMMARVTLGHTGRSVHNPSRSVTLLLAIIIAAAIIRVILPLIAAHYYAVWVLIAQLLWIAAFFIFVIVHWSMLTQPRVDGQSG
jgi:uncharacterized protein involved in response to NO